jgi:hypothetical protein
VKRRNITEVARSESVSERAARQAGQKCCTTWMSLSGSPSSCAIAMAFSLMTRRIMCSCGRTVASAHTTMIKSLMISMTNMS